MKKEYSILKKNRRAWWQEPSKATDMDEHRVVSTIELFCDLIFVAYVAGITHGLSRDTTAHGIVTYIVLFTIGWVIWLNSALYHDLHGNDDFRTRFITFLQMIFIGSMTVFTHDPLHHDYYGFVIALSGIIFLHAHLWRETGISDPSHKVFSKPYSRGFYIAGIFLLCSLFFPVDYRIIYLLIAIVCILTPFITNYILSDEVNKEDFLNRMKVSHALIERSNLYFIIVLGEIIIGSLNGIAGHDINLENMLIFLLNFMTAFGIWFIHFEFVGHIQHKETAIGYYMWLLSFYLEAMMVAAIGSVAYMGYQHLSIVALVIPTIIFFLATLLHFAFNKKIENPNIHVDTSNTVRYMTISLVLLMSAMIIHNIIIGIVLYLLALYIPIVSGVVHWIGNSESL